jgi:two-component system, OmpR family, sensor histidine kinase KdpD
VTTRDERETGQAERAALVSKLTHEIRGPVSTIRGLAGTTLAHYDRLDDGERREFLGLIRQEAERLERTVEQIALALKLDAGTVRFDIRRQDVGVIVRGAVDATETGEHPIRVDVEDGIEAPVDSLQIAFVIRQLLENAAAFSPPDAPIAVALRREGADVVIEVRDRGPGIPSEQRETVFERFAGWRPPDYEDRPGAGLGLYISRAIAREHGGDVSVAEGPGGGTMLGVRFPAEERMAGTL